MFAEIEIWGFDDGFFRSRFCFSIHYFLMEIEICAILRHPKCVPDTQFGVPGHVCVCESVSFHRWFRCQAIFYVRIKFGNGYGDGGDDCDDGDGTKWLTMTILIFGVLALTIFILFACAHVWLPVRADFFFHHLHQDWICEPKHKWMLLIIISAVWCIHDRFVFLCFLFFSLILVECLFWALICIRTKCAYSNSISESVSKQCVCVCGLWMGDSLSFEIQSRFRWWLMVY